jgi:hypothetical protein
MAHALPGARSVLCVRSTRAKDGELTSNIVTGYGHTTIPRHLRDVAISEYGIADLRGRTDGECVAAMLNIADSRFQDALLAAAKRANKIDAGYRIPDEFRNNTPARLEEAFAESRAAGLFSEYPFGTDLTAEEIDLAHALRWLKDNMLGARKLTTIARALLRANDTDRSYLERLKLSAPENFTQRLTAKLVGLALASTRRPPI